MSHCRSKKLINAAEDCVDENIEGYLRVNTGIRRVANHRIQVRDDYEQVIRTNHVTIVSGGGSGHEPHAMGYVGRGMLTASVMGSIFASPPSEEILQAIRLVAKNNSAGCLLIIANYTGDRLNFGLAMEKARHEGIKVRSVTVGEDCAMESKDKSAGRRGLTGLITTYKLAGALSEEGKSLDEMVETLNVAIQQMGSIGLSLSPCSVPGSGPTFTVADDEMELGLGVHGEAGVKTLKLKTAKETVKIMIDHMSNPESGSHLNLSKGDKIACFLNNLGSTTQLEMNILTREALSYLEDTIGVTVERIYTAEFETSLEMAGFIITILHVNDNILGLLDAQTNAPAWPRHRRLSDGSKVQDPIHVETESTKIQKIESACFETKDECELMHSCIRNVCESLISSEIKLNLLDTEGGDGDCGSTLSRGARVLLSKLLCTDNTGLPVSSPYSLSMAAASIAEKSMGGSSGALYSLFFTSAATCLKEDLSRQSWYRALETGISTIQRYGGADPGDRTMLDPLHAACQAFERNLKGESLVQLLKDMAESAETTARSTAGMKALAGRASYVSSDRLKQPDPGAVAVAIWLRAISDTIYHHHVSS